MVRTAFVASHAAAFLCCAALTASSAASAQGLPDPRTGVVYPSSQAAAVEDATALMVNPAGLAGLEGMEVNLGGFLRSHLDAGQSDVDGTIAFSPGGGLGLGFGSGLTLANGLSPLWRTSAGVGVGDRSFSLGVGLHAFQKLGGGGRADWLVDTGAQLRPARWLAFGASLEGLGNQDIVPTSARLGLSVRPLDELLTIGLDARLVPGARDISSSLYTQNMQLLPALVARLDLGGVAVTAGVDAKNIGVSVPGPTEVELLFGLELSGEHLGLAALGGVDGVGGPAQDFVGGVRLRSSTAAYPTLFPDSGRWLTMTLTGDGVPVEKNSGIFDALFGDHETSMGILTALNNYADDPSVDGIVLRLKGLSLGWGRVAELRAALARMKANGKKVVIHMDGGDDADVFFASVADKVYLTPAGGLDMNGLRADMTYFADTLDKIGVEAEAVSAGRYKSAPRTFTADEPSPEEIEVENALLDGVYGALTETVAKGRGLTVEQVKAAIDKGGLTAQEALDSKIVDELAYEDELDKKVEGIAGHPVQLEEHFLDREEHDERWDDPPRIALIPVAGDITMGRGGGGLFGIGGGGAGADDIVEAVDRAAGDDDVKAIVLRIDSPGGDALASDLIWRAIMKAREKKPVVASMGDVAASGGYYVASAADTIYAEPNTITGSIGVFGLMFNIERLADDAGVRTYSLQRGALPGPSLWHSLADDERGALQAQVNNTYERFLDAVITGRGKAAGLEKEKLRDIAEGHVWTGAQAKERKLVDNIGGIADALSDARKRAHLGDDEDVALDVITGHEDDLLKLTGLASVFGGGGPGSRAAAVEEAARLLLGDPDAVAFLLAEKGRPMTRAPVTVHVH